MSKYDQYTLVLWADRFQEMTATLIITELRRAGLRVKVIGLTRQQSKGAYGLALVPDITLHQALPLLSQTVLFFIPAALSNLTSLFDDPMLSEFLEQVRQRQIPIFVAAGEPTAASEEELMDLVKYGTFLPAGTTTLIEFVRELASTL